MALQPDAASKDPYAKCKLRKAANIRGLGSGGTEWAHWIDTRLRKAREQGDRACVCARARAFVCVRVHARHPYGNQSQLTRDKNSAAKMKDIFSATFLPFVFGQQQRCMICMVL